MNTKIKKICLTALFMAIGIVLPYFTMNMKIIGKMILPMHYPVIICGIICGKYYGLIVGALLPIVRYLIVGMPILYPTAIAMSVELATYGFFIGLFYNNNILKKIFKKKEEVFLGNIKKETSPKIKNIFYLYECLILTMIIGRIIWGIVYFTLVSLMGQKFTASMFLASAFLNSLIGIVCQLVVIPIIIIKFQWFLSETLN